MSELASAIIALIIGAMLGLLMGALLSDSLYNSITRDWIIDGGFEFNGIAYKVERLNQ